MPYSQNQAMAESRFILAGCIATTFAWLRYQSSAPGKVLGSRTEIEIFGALNTSCIVVVACQVLTQWWDMLRQAFGSVGWARSLGNDAQEKGALKADFNTVENISYIQDSASPYPYSLCDCIVLYY